MHHKEHRKLRPDHQNVSIWNSDRISQIGSLDWVDWAPESPEFRGEKSLENPVNRKSPIFPFHLGEKEPRYGIFSLPQRRPFNIYRATAKFCPPASPLSSYLPLSSRASQPCWSASFHVFGSLIVAAFMPPAQNTTWSPHTSNYKVVALL